MRDDLPDILLEARALLENTTPLASDCGRLCDCRCCSSMEGETTGMLLFPGEDMYYEDMPDYRVVPSPAGDLLICAGRCRREDRPLSCRLFPLLPVLRGDAVKVAVDLRARPVCPLAQQGPSAMTEAFVEAVRGVGQLLAEDPAQRAFLQRLTDQQDDLRALRRRFGGDDRV